MESSRTNIVPRTHLPKTPPARHPPALWKAAWLCPRSSDRRRAPVRTLHQREAGEFHQRFGFELRGLPRLPRRACPCKPSSCPPCPVPSGLPCHDSPEANSCNRGGAGGSSPGASVATSNSSAARRVGYARGAWAEVRRINRFPPMGFSSPPRAPFYDFPGSQSPSARADGRRF